ncbi:MAG: orotate phosphoribosyltransferase [Acidimicrobiales bacterium]
MGREEAGAQPVRDQVFEACLTEVAGEAVFDVVGLGGRPELFKEVVGRLAATIPEGTEVLAAVRIEGSVLVGAVAAAGGIPFAVVQRGLSSQSATHREIGGASVSGRRVAVVEAVVASGLEAMEAALELREAGAVVGDVLCVAARPDPGTLQRLAGDRLRLWPVFAWQDG